MEQKTFDMQVIDFKNNVAVAIKDSGLPVTVLVMVFNEISQVLNIQQQMIMQKIDNDKSKENKKKEEVK